MDPKIIPDDTKRKGCIVVKCGPKTKRIHPKKDKKKMKKQSNNI